MELVYLDNNSTTRPDPRVVEAMLPYLSEWYGNPSSVHRFGQRSRQAIDEARGKVAALIGCGEGELIWTSGGTESTNMAIRGMLGLRSPRNRIVTTTVEHSATRELCQSLAKSGTQVIEIGVDRDGRLDEVAFADAITPDTAVASVMLANNETGVIFPIERLAAICRGCKVPLHCDATQAIGRLGVDVKAAGFDLMSFSGHKFHGPKGVGGLYVRRGLPMSPLVLGGPQERGRRGGTENLPGIVGLGEAARWAGESLDQMTRVSAMRDRLESTILQTVEGSHRLGSAADRLPNTTNIGFERLQAEAILILLSEQGVCASAGAACSSGSLEASHVIRAMGIDPKIAHGAIRLSLSRFTTDAEIDRALSVLPAAIARLQMVLPVSPAAGRAS